MPFQKGHQFSKGLKNSGRKTKVEEIKRAIEDIKEKVTNEALLELSRSKVYQQLLVNGDTQVVAKDFAMPILLKGMVEKIDHTTLGEKITDNPKIKELADLLRNGNKDDIRRFDIGGDGVTPKPLVREASDTE